MNPSSKQFFGGLESLRGIAALMVVFYHIEWVNPLTHHLIFRNGYLMVDLFFVLSGFVISYNYGQKIRNARDAGHFMFLRFGRLYPLHLFFLLAFLGIEVAKYAGELKFGFVPYGSSAFSLNNTSSFIANLLLVQPFCPFANKSFNSPSWSIGVEFYTYLVFALVVLFVSEKKKISIISCFLVLLTASMLIFFLGGGQRRTVSNARLEFYSVHPWLLFGCAGIPDTQYLPGAYFTLERENDHSSFCGFIRFFVIQRK